MEPYSWLECLGKLLKKKKNGMKATTVACAVQVNQVKLYKLFEILECLECHSSDFQYRIVIFRLLGQLENINLVTMHAKRVTLGEDILWTRHIYGERA